MSYVNYCYGMTYQNPYPNYQGQSYYSQPQQQMGMGLTQNTPQMQQPQQNFIPMFYINGIIGAKAFTMTSPNSTILLKDSESNMIYEKKSDAEGRCTISAFEMKPVNLDNNGLPIKNVEENNKDVNNINYLTKEDLKDIVNKDDFKTLQDTFEERLNKLSTTIENLSTKALNARNNNNNNRNYNNNNYRGK